MTIEVTMLDTRYGEDGTVWAVGTVHQASTEFAQYLIDNTFATGVLPTAVQSYPGGMVVATATEVAALSGEPGLVYVERDGRRRVTLRTDDAMVPIGAGVGSISPARHITRVLNGADAARRVRPDATYSTARWCTPAGAGAKDGTSLAAAFGLAELNTALATTDGLHVYMVGNFEPAAYNTAGPLLTVVADDVRLDFDTYGATIRGYSGATWTASGTNGEYYTTASNQQRNYRLTENGARMQGVSPADCGAAMDTTALDAGADTITLAVYRELAVNDLIAWISGTANGLSPGTAYYVKTATAVSGGEQTITLSTTPGGATVNLTGTTSGRMFSLVGGRDGDPVPGSLEPGQFAWAPHEARVYMKPSSGVPGDHVYTWWQTGTSPNFIVVADAAGTCDNCEIVGGDFCGAPTYGILAGNASNQGYATGTKVYGAKVHACESGIVACGAQSCDFAYNEVWDCTDHAIGSKVGTNNEALCTYRYNWVHDLAQQPWDSGDCQALVTNPSSDDVLIIGNVAQRIGHTRDLITHPLGLQDTINTGTIVCDSSQRVRVVGNYLEDCHGEGVEIGPNDVQAVAYLQISGNVFDNRALPAEQDSELLAMCTKSVYVGVTSTSTTGYGTGYDCVVEGNLFLAGDTRNAIEDGVFAHGCVVVRNAQDAGDVDAKLKLRDNVFLLLHPTAPANAIALRYDADAAAATGVDSDHNTYYAASPNALAVQDVDSTAAAPTPAQEIAVADVATGWTSPDGTVNDKHSTVLTSLDGIMEHATVLRCLSV